MDQALIDKRLRGELPLIEIDGYKYIIDWRLKELRCQSDPSKRMDLSRMGMNAEGTAYTCLYDTMEKQVVYRVNEVSCHKDIAVLTIPYELKLDPVGVARQYGLKDTELLQTYPIQEGLKAKLRRLSPKEQKLIKQGKSRRKGKHL